MKNWTTYTVRFLGEMRFYFVRGHTVYLSHPFSILNFTLICYNFLIKDWTFIPSQYNNFYLFALVFITLFIPLCIVLGVFDCKRGLLKSEYEKHIAINPIYIKLFKKLDDIEKMLKEKEE